MRILRALPLLLAIGGCVLAAAPASAETPAVTLTLAQRWNTGQVGAWTPYVATVRNEGSADFAGDVRLHPVGTLRGPAPQGWPDYQARIAVPAGSDRSVTFYVLEPPGGYEASLSDSAGRRVAEGVTVTGLVDGVYAVGVLSDQPQAGSRIEALKPVSIANGSFSSNAGLRASRFGSAQDFPTNAVFLSGLNAIVVDDFDVSTLSDAQLRALRDFVGLGGSLVAAGGASWRRTLLPLAEKGFGALNPNRSAQASLQPLADLLGATTAVTAPIAAGDIVSGRTLLGAPGQAPLAVEAIYGSGRIIDLAYDPLAEPIATDGSGLDQLAWSLALDRAVLDTTPAGSRGVPIPQTPYAGGFPIQGAAGSPGAAASAEEIVSILQNTPAAAVPPIGLLGALLVIYVLLAGPLNYFALKSFGRRELMWLSVPVVALLFTSGAYVVGAGVHGASYFDNEVQVLRLGPDGVAEVHAYHGLYPPHRGNFTVDIGANTLASTTLGALSNPGSPESAVVDSGSRTRVVLTDTTYGGFRSLQTLSITRPPLQSAVALEAHLKIAQEKVTGTVRNTGDRPIEELSLVSGSGQQASIARELAPRATVSVDAPLSSAGQATPFPQPRTYSSGPDLKRSMLLRVAAGAAVTGHQGDWSLTGLTDTGGALTVDGSHPAHSGLAAVIDPIRLDSVDTLNLAARASMLASSSGVPYHYDVFDLAIPAGYGSTVKLGYEVQPAGLGAAQGVIRSIEVYDWNTGTWRQLPAVAPNPATRSLTANLTPGETKGTVRVRVNEQSSALASNMRLVGAG